MGIAVLGEPFGLSVFELSVFGLWPALLLHFLSPSLPRPPFLGIRWSCAVRLVGDETSPFRGVFNRNAETPERVGGKLLSFRRDSGRVAATGLLSSPLGLPPDVECPIVGRGVRGYFSIASGRRQSVRCAGAKPPRTVEKRSFCRTGTRIAYGFELTRISPVEQTDPPRETTSLGS